METTKSEFIPSLKTKDYDDLKVGDIIKLKNKFFRISIFDGADYFIEVDTTFHYQDICFPIKKLVRCERDDGSLFNEEGEYQVLESKKTKIVLGKDLPDKGIVRPPDKNEFQLMVEVNDSAFFDEEGLEFTRLITFKEMPFTFIKKQYREDDKFELVIE